MIGCGDNSTGSITQVNNITALPTPAMITVNANVQLPSDITPSNVTLLSEGGTSTLLINGDFTAKIFADYVSSICVVFNGKEFAYMRITFGDKDPQGINQPLVINAQTTAEALVFLSPYCMNNMDIQLSIRIMEVIKNNSKVKEFGDILAQIHNENSPAENEQFKTAYNDAIISVLKDLATKSTSMNSSSNPSNQERNIIKLTNSKSLNSSSVLPYTIENYSVFSTRVKIELKDSGGWKADESAIQNNTQIITSSDNPLYKVKFENLLGLDDNLDMLGDIAELDTARMNNSIDFSNINKQAYPRKDNGYRDFVYIPCKSIFSYLNILKIGADAIIEHIKSEVGLSKGISEDIVYIPADKQAIYIVRIYYGKMDREYLSRFPDGIAMQQHTLCANVVMLCMDTLSCIPGIITAPIKDTVKNTYKDAIAEYNNKPISSIEAALEFIILIERNLVDAFIKQKTKEAEKDVLKFLLTSLSNITVDEAKNIINIPEKLSNVGQTLQRSATLLWGINGISSPLGSIIIMIGSPLVDPNNSPDPNTPSPPTTSLELLSKSIPDGSTISPSLEFTQTYTFKNGSTTLNNCRLYFDGGDKMNAPDSVSLPSSISSGQQFSVDIKMTAPSSVGTYTNYWQIKDSSGNKLGPQVSTQINCTADYMGQIVEQSVNPTINLYQTKQITVKIKNTGTKPWYPGEVRLGTYNPQDRGSHFSHPNNSNGFNSDWLSDNRVQMQGNSTIQPGQVATFIITITDGWNPSTNGPRLVKGTYREEFKLVKDIGTPTGWFLDDNLSWDINVTDPIDYYCCLVSQSNHPTVAKGGTKEITVKFKNLGKIAWNPSTLHLGTDRPQDRNCGFYTAADSRWLSTNRIKMVETSSVQTGQDGTFTFTITGNPPKGVYPEYFRLVDDKIGGQWFNEPDDIGFFWNITVGDAGDVEVIVDKEGGK